MASLGDKQEIEGEKSAQPGQTNNNTKRGTELKRVKGTHTGEREGCRKGRRRRVSKVERPKTIPINYSQIHNPIGNNVCVCVREGEKKDKT